MTRSTSPVKRKSGRDPLFESVRGTSETRYQKSPLRAPPRAGRNPDRYRPAKSIDLVNAKIMIR